MFHMLQMIVSTAHCDVPCGIYDPHSAQVAAHTVYRMTQLLQDTADAHKIARLTATKEQHAELCKKEVRILFGDYFKKEHAEKYTELQELVWDIFKLASTTKQEVNLEMAKKLIAQVNKLAEIFWASKSIETFSIKAPYPTEQDIVYPKLG